MLSNQPRCSDSDRAKANGARGILGAIGGHFALRRIFITDTYIICLTGK